MSGEVIRLPKGASVPVTLKVLEYELFHFCPLKVSLLISLFLFLQGRLCLIISDRQWHDVPLVPGDHIQHLVCSHWVARHVQLHRSSGAVRYPRGFRHETRALRWRNFLGANLFSQRQQISNCHSFSQSQGMRTVWGLLLPVPTALHRGQCREWLYLRFSHGIGDACRSCPTRGNV